MTLVARPISDHPDGLERATVYDTAGRNITYGEPLEAEAYEPPASRQNVRPAEPASQTTITTTTTVDQPHHTRELALVGNFEGPR